MRKNYINYLSILITIIFLFNSCAKTDNNSNTTTVTTVPFPPTDLTATVVSTTQVNLSWVDKSTNEVGFKIERKTSTTQYTTVTSLGADISTYNDNGLSVNTSYTYRVYSYNTLGASPTYSNEVTVTTVGLPSLTTTVVSNFTAVDGSSGGNITNDGGSAITARGIVWSTSQNPTVTLPTKTTDGTGIGIFTSIVRDLTASTKYYVKAYATNAAGTAYGNEVSFTTNSVDIKSGLLAYYPFTGNAGDSSGNGYHGVVSGALLFKDRFNKENNCYSFNGTDSKITIPLKQNNFKSYSVSVWFNTNYGGQLIDGRGTNNLPGLDAFIHNQSTGGINKGKTMFVVHGPGISLGKMSNLTYLDGKWHHFVGTFIGNSINVNPDEFSIYIDGELISQSNSTTSAATLPINSNSEIIIGANQKLNYSPYLEYFLGLIDDVRIYNRVLSPTEVKYLFNN